MIVVPRLAVIGDDALVLVVRGGRFLRLFSLLGQRTMPLEKMASTNETSDGIAASQRLAGVLFTADPL
jgi:hypothetical protein